MTQHLFVLVLLKEAEPSKMDSKQLSNVTTLTTGAVKAWRRELLLEFLGNMFVFEFSQFSS